MRHMWRGRICTCDLVLVDGGAEVEWCGMRHAVVRVVDCSHNYTRQVNKLIL